MQPRMGELSPEPFAGLLEEDERLSIEEAALAASALAALGGRGHQEALGMLSAMAERVSRRGRGRTVVA